MKFTKPAFESGNFPVIIISEIELNITSTPKEFPKCFKIQDVQYNLLGFQLFHGNNQQSKINHFIFKFFDGQNFYDIDNMRKKIQKTINNTLNYNGKNYRISAAFYILDNL
jgi:hypothetical protein